MRCPHCNTENEKNAIFCAACNAWILGTMYDDQNAPDLPEESDQDSATLKRKLRHLSIIVGSVMAAVLVALALILFLPEKVETPLFIYKESSVYAYSPYDQVILVQDGKLIENGSFPASKYGEICAESLDGRTKLYLTAEKEMVLVRDGQLLSRGYGVTNAQMSASGRGLAIHASIDDKLQLLYFDSMTLQQTILHSDDVLDFVISPDGLGVAFSYVGVNGKRCLAYYADGKTTTINYDIGGFYLLGLSDNGKQIYVYDPETLACYDQNGEVTILDGSSLVSPWRTFRYFNADHSQLLYTDGQKTWICENGQAAQLYCEGNLQPLYPAGTNAIVNGYTVTCPAYDLKDMVFYEEYAYFNGSPSSSKLLYSVRLWKNGQIVLDKSQDAWLDKSGSIVYFLGENRDLMRLDISNQKSEAKTIAEKVSTFFISPDASRVCYRLERTLYCCDGKGKQARKITDAFANTVYFSEDGTPYYVQLGTLYAIVENEARPVLKYVTDVAEQADGTLYFISGGSLYMSGDGGAITTLIYIENEWADPNIPTIT